MTTSTASGRRTTTPRTSAPPADTTTPPPDTGSPAAPGTTPQQAPAPAPRSEHPATHREGIVVLPLPAGTDPTWARVSEILRWHHITAALPLAAFPIRRRTGVQTRWSARGLLAPVRHHGLVTHATGGPMARLDLHHLTCTATANATARWWAWTQHIAATTPPAKQWQHFLTEHRNAPAKVSLAEATRRYGAQPRVLAMLAYNSYPYAPHRFALDDLDAYQAGLTVYVALHWQHPLVADALITRWGQLLQPATTTVADRLQYLTTATQVIHQLDPRDHLVAVRAAIPAPSTTNSGA
jgi:hypothetical protein